MDKRVVFAVAGSGKTSTIINGLEENTRALIVTYTDKNTTNLKERVLLKFGCIPSGIRIYTYYKFLYSFCFKPILGHKTPSKGITWDLPPRFAKKNSSQYYFDKNKRLYGNRLAKLIVEAGAIPELLQRIEKYFDQLYIDEVQDFAGNDFNLLCSLSKANVKQLLVGDFYQHTFDTSRDGNINGKLHDNYISYKSKLAKAGFTLDLNLLSNSYRCSPTVCEFVSDQLGVKIESHRTDETKIKTIECSEDANKIFHSPDIVKLFYQSSSKYSGFTDNWGATKGMDCYYNVCIVLNSKTFKNFKNLLLKELAQKTKNKLYVACTRAKGDLYFVSESMYKIHKK